MGDPSRDCGSAPSNRRTMALAEIALRRHGLRRARVRLLRDGFKQVFRVEHSSRGVFALRTYSEPPKTPKMSGADPRFRTGPGLRSPETLSAQLDWLSELRRETDLPVPEPVPLPDGSLLGHASFADLPPGLRLRRRVSSARRELYRADYPGRHFALFRWVSGRTKEGDPRAEDIYRVGAFVARMHDHAASHRPPEPRALPRWDWHWPFGESAPVWDLGELLYSTGEMEAFREASRLVRRDLDRLGYGSGAFGVIHRDLTLHNLLFQDGYVGATDFDLCGYAHYPFDLSVVLRTFGRRCADRIEHLRAQLLEGYGRVRVLPDAQVKSLAAFGAMQRVAAVNRTLELRASGTMNPQARSERFLRRAVEWLEVNYLG